MVDGRRRELATLRALGFRGGAVVASVLTESILLALPGALLGAGFASLLFNGLTASPFGFTFHLAVTAPIALVEDRARLRLTARPPRQYLSFRRARRSPIWRIYNRLTPGARPQAARLLAILRFLPAHRMLGREACGS